MAACLSNGTNIRPSADAYESPKAGIFHPILLFVGTYGGVLRSRCANMVALRSSRKQLVMRGQATRNSGPVIPIYRADST